LQRQLGASHVDLDSEAGWVRFSLPEPVAVDFGQVADVLDSASYELHGIEIELTGTVVEESGSLWLVVDQTEQRLLLDARPPATVTRKIRSTVLDWQTDSPRLSPIPAADS